MELDASARQNHVAIMKREAKTQKVSRALDPSVVRQPHLNLSPYANTWILRTVPTTTEEVQSRSILVVVKLHT